MSKKNIFLLLILSFSISSCGWIQSLRREVADDDAPKSMEDLADYDRDNDPMMRNVPPPVNLVDEKAAALAGSPLDYSGNRAKMVRVKAQDFTNDTMKSENSLWTEEGQNNYLFARNKLKNPGDLVTVIIEDGLRNDMIGSVKKLLPPEYRDSEIRVPGLTKESKATPQDATSTQAKADAAGSAANAADDKASDPNAQSAVKKDQYTSEDMLTAEVLERYPNGNVKLRGIKRIPFKRQVRNIEVLAIVKGSDISEDDVVKSSKFFDQKVELYK